MSFHSFYIFFCLCCYFHASINPHQSKPPSPLPQPSNNARSYGWLCWFERAPTSCPSPVTVRWKRSINQITLNIKNEVHTIEYEIHDQTIQDHIFHIWYMYHEVHIMLVGCLVRGGIRQNHELPWQNQQLEALLESKKEHFVNLS